MTEVIHRDNRFIYQSSSNRLGVCELKLIDVSGRKVLLVTERCYNPGPSVTNAIEHVVTAAYEKLGDKLPPISMLTVVEHYDELSYKGGRGGDETFDVVRFQQSNPFSGPIWSPLRDEQLLHALGAPTECAGDM